MSLYSLSDNSCGIRKCSAAGLHFYPAICTSGPAARVIWHNASICFHWKALCKQLSGLLLLFTFWFGITQVQIHSTCCGSMTSGEDLFSNESPPEWGPLTCSSIARPPSTLWPLQGVGEGRGVVLFTDMMSLIVTSWCLYGVNDQLVIQIRGPFNSRGIWQRQESLG